MEGAAEIAAFAPGCCDFGRNWPNDLLVGFHLILGATSSCPTLLLPVQRFRFALRRLSRRSSTRVPMVDERIQLMALRREYRTSFTFVVCCILTLVRLHWRTSIDNRFPQKPSDCPDSIRFVTAPLLR